MSKKKRKVTIYNQVIELIIVVGILIATMIDNDLFFSLPMLFLLYIIFLIALIIKNISSKPVKNKNYFCLISLIIEMVILLFFVFMVVLFIVGLFMVFSDDCGLMGCGFGMIVHLLNLSTW